MTLNSQDLAAGFAEQAARWAQDAGAPPAQCQLARRLAAALSLAVADGHACLPLDFQARNGESAPRAERAERAERAGHAPPTWPVSRSDPVRFDEARLDRAAVLATRIVGEAQAPGSFPLILDGDGRLYLHRHFDYEKRLARRLLRAARPSPIAQGRAAPRADGPIDWQKLATALALQRRFTLISGGPGTGKTSTVVNLLAALLENEPLVRIVLAAPTGKAAARMQDALRARATTVSAAVRDALPKHASTVHRLLGVDRRSGLFHHHAGRRLALDVLVVDEASMLDLALATQLFEAVPEHARIVLLGDKDQLAAVESGAVFAELSAQQGFRDATCVALAEQMGLPSAQLRAALAPATGSGLDDSVVWLREQFRFAPDSVIGRLASAVRDGEAGQVLALCQAVTSAPSGNPALRWLKPEDSRPSPDQHAELFDGFRLFFAAVLANVRPAEIFSAFDTFRVLCAVRNGPWGARAIGETLSDGARALVDPPGEAGFRSAWYRGRPVMVLRNDPVLNLFNGDIGIALVHPDEGELQICFLLADGALRWVAPVRLPPHETAFAMTIHKSQGSEFGRVALVLPPEPSPVLTRELLYTGVTRARDALLLLASAERLGDAVCAPTVRDTGLLARIAEEGPFLSRDAG